MLQSFVQACILQTDNIGISFALSQQTRYTGTHPATIVLRALAGECYAANYFSSGGLP